MRAYLSGELSPSEIRSKYNIKDRALYDWVRLYETRGAAGLIPVIRNRRYSREPNNCAVRDYLDGVGSLRFICTKYDISDKRYCNDG